MDVVTAPVAVSAWIGVLCNIMKLEFETDESQCLLLKKRTFENIQFEHLQITGSVDREIRIENCKFLNCSTSCGTCFICGNVTLDRVVISNLECGDAIHIDSGVKLKQVVIAGPRPGMLKITPLDEDGFVTSEPKHSELQLDISDFYGAVEIIGISGARIKKDATRQATVRSNWLTEVNWKLLG